MKDDVSGESAAIIVRPPHAAENAVAEVRCQADCLDCEDVQEPCAYHRRLIHESWHERGLFWIRSEECHEHCPGLKSKAV